MELVLNPDQLHLKIPMISAAICGVIFMELVVNKYWEKDAPKRSYWHIMASKVLRQNI